MHVLEALFGKKKSMNREEKELEKSTYVCFAKLEIIYCLKGFVCVCLYVSIFLKTYCMRIVGSVRKVKVKCTLFFFLCIQQSLQISSILLQVETADIFSSHFPFFSLPIDKRNTGQEENL
jgi:hypothetical protein